MDANAVRNFVTALDAVILSRSRSRDGLQAKARQRLLASIPGDMTPDPTARTGHRPACQYLEQAYGLVEQTGDSLTRELVNALRVIEPLFPWQNENDLCRGLPDHMLDDYAEAKIFGIGGMVSSDTVEIGALIMAADTFYPNHHHPEEETYVALSAGYWGQDDGLWLTPGVGGLVYNTYGITHAMQSVGVPMFAVFCSPLLDSLPDAEG
jgi:hypothetical protein